MKEKLWTSNFIYCFLGSIISACGGIGLNLALSMYIYQQTQSTVLSGTYAAVSMIPNFVLPLFAGTFIDRRNPLKVLVTNEIILSIFFVFVAYITMRLPFSFMLYLGIVLCIGVFGTISELSYMSVVPHIMKKENYARGNAILNIVYPAAQIVVTPLAIWLFDSFGVSMIFLLFGIACALDAFMESHIKVDFKVPEKVEEGKLKQHMKDIQEGFSYFIQDSAVRSVFLYFTFMTLANSLTLLIYPFFTQNPALGDAKYSLLMSIQGAGYLVGGLLHYFIEIPQDKRFTVSLISYSSFIVLEALFFFMNLPLMFVSRFVLGIAGMNSANIRISAMQSHVPNEIRAKINALFNVLIAISTFICQIVIGALGEVFAYGSLAIVVNVVLSICLFIFLLPRKNKVRELYNYSND